MSANHHENNGADRRTAEELAVLATTRMLDQLSEQEESRLADALAKPAYQDLRAAAEQAGRLAPAVVEAVGASELPAPSPDLRVAIEAELEQTMVTPASPATVKQHPRRWDRVILSACVAVAMTGVVVSLFLPAVQMARKSARHEHEHVVKNWLPSPAAQETAAKSFDELGEVVPQDSPVSPDPRATSSVSGGAVHYTAEAPATNPTSPSGDGELQSQKPQDTSLSTSSHFGDKTAAPSVTFTAPQAASKPVPGVSNEQRWMHLEREQGAAYGSAPDLSGRIATKESIPVTEYYSAPNRRANTSGPMPGMGTGAPGGAPGMGMPGAGIPAGGPQGAQMGMAGMPGPIKSLPQSVRGEDARNFYYESLITDGTAVTDGYITDLTAPVELAELERYARGRWRFIPHEGRERESASGEAYAPIHENAFRMVRDEPLSTFSIDVDTASYANVRRFLTQGQLPPRNAVRVEELLNYFSYDYPQPQEEDPFSVNMEVAECPWRPENRLLRVGLKGRDVPQQKRAASNLVFLIDVSGSMQPENKLPLIKTALKLLVQELTENDRVSIVTYAGDAGLRLPSTNGTEQSRIMGVIDSLSAGGSTHGSAGITMAYDQASEYFIRGGTNRVILLTDGDLNVGITDDDALVQLIQQKAKSGVFLTVLGVGEGNLKDSKMEKLADHGNGIYAYLDGVREARKVLVEQMAGSLITIAKDVKFQIEFNPAQIQAYRLVGYENRVLANRDFNDDTKDAGEIGAGHTVTALYELVPTNVPVPPAGEPLKYQPQRVEETRNAAAAAAENTSRELLTLKLRFKRPDADTSVLRDYPLSNFGGKFGQASNDFRFASCVAMFGLVLRNSQYRGSATLAAVEEIASSSLGNDSRGYRAEFVDLVRKAESLK